MLKASQGRPPVPAPATVRPFLRFQKLPDRALAPVRRAVEADDDLRERLASVVSDDDLVGRAGWLWLHRPEGWDAEVAALVVEAGRDDEADRETKDERSARRRVEAAERAAIHGRATAEAARSEAGAARAELERERKLRREAAAVVDGLERRVKQLEVELRSARRKLDDAETQVGTLVVGAAEAQARAVELEAALLAAAVDAPVGPVVAQPSGVAPEARAPGVPLDAELLSSALRRAAGATAALGRALADAAVAVGPACAGGDDIAPGPADDVRGDRERTVARPRREPLRLPGGVFADSVEAAEVLVRRPGTLVVVDGYNVAMLGWPGLGLAEQRGRLLDALDELNARFGTTIHVVFDGAEVDGPAASSARAGRRHVRVEFSPPGVIADEVIVELVRALPVERAVVVATNDGEVRTRCRAVGANLLSSAQLLAVARR